MLDCGAPLFHSLVAQVQASAASDELSFRVLQSAVQRFGHEHLRPLGESGDVPDEAVRPEGEMGLFGLSIPERCGGIGMSTAQERELILDPGHTAPALRLVFGAIGGIGSQGVLADGTEAQKAFYLPRLVSGEFVVSLRSPSPIPAPMRHRRAIATCAASAGPSVFSPTRLAPRMTRTEGEGSSGISAFVVPADLPVIPLGKLDRKMGQSGTKAYDVMFNDVPAPQGGPLCLREPSVRAAN